MSIPFIPISTDLDTELPYHIVAAGQKELQPHINRPSGLPEFQWLHCDEGAGALIIDNKKYILTKGMGFFMHPRIPHEYYAITSKWKTSYLSFDGYGVNQTLRNIGLKEKYYVFYVSNLFIFENLLSEIIKIRASKSYERLAETSIMLYTFIIHMKDIIFPSNKEEQKIIQSTKLAPIIKFINEKYMKQISLEELASIIDVTPQHLCKIFKQEYKIRPFEYINKIRIEKSKELMYQNPFTPLKKVAHSVGFRNVSYFCTVFKKLTSLTPKEFQKNFSPEKYK